VKPKAICLFLRLIKTDKKNQKEKNQKEKSEKKKSRQEIQKQRAKPGHSLLALRAARLKKYFI
jgi:hypothetical protein